MTRRLIVMTLVGMVVLPAIAHADVVIDLRFEDGTKTKVLTPDQKGTDVAINVWVQVIGEDTTGVNDGLNHVYVALASQQVAGGAMYGGAGVGVTAGALTVPFGEVGSRPGEGKDTTPDDIQDWGDPDAEGTCLKARDGGAATPTYRDGEEGMPEPIWFDIAGPPGGTAFLVGQVTFHVGDEWTYAANFGGQTLVHAVMPTWPDMLYRYHQSFPDEVQDTNKLNYSCGDPVVLTPEPATLALLGLGGLGMILRRRRS